MSYLLDALRKSESERNRDGGPSLAETRWQSPRTRPVLTIALITVLIANVLLVGLWLTDWRPPQRDGTNREQRPAAASEPGPEAAASVAAASEIRNDAPPPTVGRAVSDDVAIQPAAAPPAMSPDTRARDGAALQQMPNIDVSTHVYSADAALSSVTINGRRLVAGDAIAPGLRLLTITETGVVVEFDGERHQIDVLQDWR
jgi:hypothetical protein